MVVFTEPDVETAVVFRTIAASCVPLTVLKRDPLGSPLATGTLA